MLSSLLKIVHYFAKAFSVLKGIVGQVGLTLRSNIIIVIEKRLIFQLEIIPEAIDVNLISILQKYVVCHIVSIGRPLLGQPFMLFVI